MQTKQDLLKYNTELNISWQLRAAAKRAVVIDRYYDKAVAFEKATGKEVGLRCDEVVLCGATQEEAKLFRQTFGGPGIVWQRAVNYAGDSLDYTYEIPHPAAMFENEPLLFRVSGSELPPSCHIEEVEEHVPATTRKVKRVTCKNGDESDVQVSKAQEAKG